MKVQQIASKRDLPQDFVQKFWIETGDDFGTFLTRFRDHDLLFTVEVVDEQDSSIDLQEAINAELRSIEARGGPSLPKPAGGSSSNDARCWEFLSCKEGKVTSKQLRVRGASKEKIVVVQIGSSSAMLAPIDYNIPTITKRFGIKNILRENAEEPEKLVIIGNAISTIMLHDRFYDFKQVLDIRAIALLQSTTSIILTLGKMTKT